MENVTDCLVLYIDDLMSVRLFIIYDLHEKKFILRGKNYDDNNNNNDNNQEDSDNDTESDSDSDSYARSNDSNVESNEFKPFSYNCKLKKHLLHFLDYLLSNNSCEYSLYNFDNLPSSSNQISYHFLENLLDKRYEIVCYESDSFDKKMCLRMLNLLKNIYNEY